MSWCVRSSGYLCVSLLRERGGRGLSSHSAVKISYERCGEVVSLLPLSHRDMARLHVISWSVAILQT